MKAKEARDIANSANDPSPVFAMIEEVSKNGGYELTLKEIHHKFIPNLIDLGYEVITEEDYYSKVSTLKWSNA